METNLYLVLFTRALAVGLFLAGLANPDKIIERSAHGRVGVYLCGAVVLALTAGTAASLLAGRHLPSAVDLHAQQQLQADTLIIDFLAGQEPWLLLAIWAT